MKTSLITVKNPQNSSNVHLSFSSIGNETQEALIYYFQQKSFIIEFFEDENEWQRNYPNSELVLPPQPIIDAALTLYRISQIEAEFVRFGVFDSTPDHFES